MAGSRHQSRRPEMRGGRRKTDEDNHTTQNLFLSKMLNRGGKSGADAGCAHVEGATICTPDGGAQHALRPAPGATAGEASGEGPTPSTTVQDAGPTDNKRSRPDKRQNTGDSGDTSQQHRMTLGTACGIFTRLMMIILLLFLQKQNLAFAVYLLGSVLSLPD